MYRTYMIFYIVLYIIRLFAKCSFSQLTFLAYSFCRIICRMQTRRTDL